MSKSTTLDIIQPEIACNLPGLLVVRVRRTPHHIAYRYFDTQHQEWRALTWLQVMEQVTRWQAALRQEALHQGDRIGIMLPNGPDWVFADMAALSLGLVVVPLYPHDRPENLAHCINDAGPKLIFIDSIEQWYNLEPIRNQIPSVTRFVCLKANREEPDHPKFVNLMRWLPQMRREFENHASAGDALATIVYTSGTSGRPKGVMLSHQNILRNAHAALQMLPAKLDDMGLSFLPLAHSFERTTGYYLPMMSGSTIGYARSPKTLAEDMLIIRPTWIAGVPRVWERMRWAILRGLEKQPFWARALFNFTLACGWRAFERQTQGKWSPLMYVWPLLNHWVASRVRAHFGSRLTLGISAGAPIHSDISKFFIGLGIQILQGYGQNEAGPTISVNTETENVLGSVGRPLPGIEIKLSTRDELLVRSSSVMMGYWNDPVGTASVLDPEGWLHTGDQGRFENEFLYIAGRLQDVITLSTGHRVAPSRLEDVILQDSLFKQVMLVGEGKPYLTALVVLNQNYWPAILNAAEVAPNDGATDSFRHNERIVLDRIASQLTQFPQHVQVRRALLLTELWTLDNGMLTPTLQLKRHHILQQHAADIAPLYPRHPISGDAAHHPR
jgi:long-chain acyl-CoA synthetase